MRKDKVYLCFRGRDLSFTIAWVALAVRSALAAVLCSHAHLRRPLQMWLLGGNTHVGFSYGGMVAFKMAELYPELVEALVISGSILAMTCSVSETTMERLGFSSSSELLLPTSVKGLKALLSVAAYKKLWFPDCLHKDYLEVMFTNRKERCELLEALVVDGKDTTIPNFPQRVHLLWGENDEIFKQELAQNMKEQLGENTTFQGIPKAGHLVHLERPCVYNRYLKQFLASLHANEARI